MMEAYHTPLRVEKEERRVFKVRLEEFTLLVWITDVTTKKNVGLSRYKCVIKKNITFAEIASGIVHALCMK